MILLIDPLPVVSLSSIDRKAYPPEWEKQFKPPLVCFRQKEVQWQLDFFLSEQLLQCSIIFTIAEHAYLFSKGLFVSTGYETQLPMDGSLITCCLWPRANRDFQLDTFLHGMLVSIALNPSTRPLIFIGTCNHLVLRS